MQRAATPCQGTASARPAAQRMAVDPAAARSRRQALLAGLAAAALLAAPRHAQASGLESVELPQMPDAPQIIKELQNRNRAKIDAADASFQSSELLRTLKERSEANKEQRGREIRDRYCLRQAEMGVGDCAGLRLIPGATKSGIQKKPQWLENLLGGGDDAEK